MGTESITTGATRFDDSVVRFTDFGTILRSVPSAEALGYFHSVRFTDSARRSS
jgi:hypothetical protein